MFHSVRRTMAVFAVVLVVGLASKAGLAQLKRYEGDFDVTISVAPPPGMGGGGVTDAQYTGHWAVEYAKEGTLTGSGVNTVNRPLASFVLTPNNLFGVSYDTSNVEVQVDYRGGGLFRFILGGVRSPSDSAVNFATNTNDFQIEYWAGYAPGVPNNIERFDYGRSDGGPRQVLSMAGTFHKAQPAPYVWGEFDLGTTFSRFDRLAGRWAIDASYVTEPPFGTGESGTITVPLRYLEITSDVPESFQFDQRDAHAILDYRDGVLQYIRLGVGTVNSIDTLAPDFLLSYRLGSIGNALTYAPQSLSTSYAVSSGQGAWTDSIGYDSAWIVPEPATLGVLVLGGLALLRRHT